MFYYLILINFILDDNQWSTNHLKVSNKSLYILIRVFSFSHYQINIDLTRGFYKRNCIIEKFNSIMIFSDDFKDDDDDDDDDDDEQDEKGCWCLMLNGVTQLMNWNILMFPKQHYYDANFLVCCKKALEEMKWKKE